MTWDGIVTKYHKGYLKTLGIPVNVEAYMQTTVLRKTLESISLEYRRGGIECEEVKPEGKSLLEQSGRREIEPNRVEVSARLNEK